MGSRVGVKTLRTPKGSAVRVFYPTSLYDEDRLPALWFRQPLDSVADGYLHTLGPWRAGSVSFAIVSPLARLAARVQVGSLRLDGCYEDVPPVSTAVPLVAWSHGLVGTGDEHALLAVRLASAGIAVALVHHGDGSSSVSDVNGVPLFYDHTYVGAKRLQGCQQRAEEMLSAIDIVRDNFSITTVGLGGFSFGAATAAHMAAGSQSRYECALLVDGMFCVEVGDGRFVDCPRLAYENGLSLPVCFINSAQFDRDPNRHGATERLKSKCAHIFDAVVVPDTAHGNFTEVLHWIPTFAAKCAGYTGASLEDPSEMYRTYLHMACTFFETHLLVERHVDA